MMKISKCCGSCTRNHGIAIAPQVDMRGEDPYLWCVSCGLPCQTIEEDFMGYVPNYPKPIDTNPFNFIEGNENKLY